MSVPSETLVRSYNSSFITHTNVHLKKLVDNTCCLLETDLIIIVKLWSFSILFKGKLSSELNLNFIKFFQYSPGLLFI